MHKKSKFRFGLKAKILFGMLLLGSLAFAAVFTLTLRNAGKFGDYLLSACDGLGEQALTGCRDALRHQAHEELAALVAAQAVMTNALLRRVTDDILTVSELAGRYLALPVANRDSQGMPDVLRSSRPADIYRYSFIGTTSPGAPALQPEVLLTMSRIHPLFSFIHGNYQEIDQLYLCTNNGVFVAYPWDDLPDDYVVEERPWYREALQAEHPVWVGPYISTMENRLTITCATVVRDCAGKTLGVSAVDIEVERIARNFIANRIMPGAQAFLLDRSGNVLARNGLDSRDLSWRDVFNRENLLQSSDPVLRKTASRMLAGGHGVEQFDYAGSSYFLAYSPVKATGWCLGVMVEEKYLTAAAAKAAMKIRGNVARQEAHIHESMDNNLNINVLIGGAILLFIVFLGMTLSGRITAPVMLLKKKAVAIGQGDFDSGIELHTGDELEKLDATFERMFAGIRQYLARIESTVRERESEQRELAVAAAIQRAMLPGAPPVDARVEVESAMRPARIVSGDFYDFFMVDKQRMYLLFGKAHGKGVAAAMQMVRIKTLLSRKAATGVPPNELLYHINFILSRSRDGGGSGTAIAGALLDLSCGTLQLCNAGNPAPLLVEEATADVKRLQTKSEPGITGSGERPREDFVSQTVKLSPGSRLLFFTEGVVKVVNSSGERFGRERLSRIFADAATGSDESVVQSIMREIDGFAASVPLNDDITLVSILYKGASCAIGSTDKQ